MQVINGRSFQTTSQTLTVSSAFINSKIYCYRNERSLFLLF